MRRPLLRRSSSVADDVPMCRVACNEKLSADVPMTLPVIEKCDCSECLLALVSDLTEMSDHWTVSAFVSIISTNYELQ